MWDVRSLAHLGPTDISPQWIRPVMSNHGPDSGWAVTASSNFGK